MRVVRLAGGVLALSTLLFGLAACGGDDESEAPPAATVRPAAEGVATEEPDTIAEPQATEVPDEEASSSLDACALVTREEAEAVLGASVGEPAREDTPPIAACTYETPDFDSVSVSVLTYDDSDQAEEGFQMAIDINDFPEVPGIGDRAYDARPAFGLTVLKGRYELEVDVSLEGDEAEFEAAKDLAATAVERLP